MVSLRESSLFGTSETGLDVQPENVQVGKILYWLDDRVDEPTEITRTSNPFITENP